MDNLRRRFEVKMKVVGPASLRSEKPDTIGGIPEVLETRILNRVVRVTRDGWEAEADQRHADIIVKALGMENANAVKAPGEEAREAEEWEEELGAKEASLYRAVAARANYLALDRADLQYSVKEICRLMSKPTERGMRKLRRLARYLAGAPRVVWKFDWQGEEDLTVYSDSDYAGCRRTARSTSGGVFMRGSHCLKSYSKTQKKVTLSSGEAELSAIVTASSEAVGLLQMAESLGNSLRARVMVDSSAALAVTQRKGNGKLRHVRVGELWVQQAAEDGELEYQKVKGSLNLADVCTKHLPGSKLWELITKASQERRAGRADEALCKIELSRTSCSFSLPRTARRSNDPELNEAHLKDAQ